MDDLQRTIENAFEDRGALSPASAPAAVREAVAEVIEGLDRGRLRVAEKSGDDWTTHQWIKKAVLLSFRLEDNAVTEAAGTRYFDKVPSKFADYTAERFAVEGFRVVPPAMARREPGARQPRARSWRSRRSRIRGSRAGAG